MEEAELLVVDERLWEEQGQSLIDLLLQLAFLFVMRELPYGASGRDVSGCTSCVTLRFASSLKMYNPIYHPSWQCTYSIQYFLKL